MNQKILSKILDKLVDTCGEKACSGLVLKIFHVKQSFDWDCGMACLQMALLQRHKISEDKFHFAVRDHGAEKNIWTIDLAYICMLLGIKHLLSTITLGANENFAEEPFYKNQEELCFNEEQKRINSLFNKALENKVSIQKKDVSLLSIVSHIIIYQQPVVILVDAFKLETNQQDDSLGKLMKFLNIDEHDEDASTKSLGFCGHFILIIGFDLQEGVFYFHDPSQEGGNSVCQMQTLESARRSFGTDEDILFLFPSEEFHCNC